MSEASLPAEHPITCYCCGKQWKPGANGVEEGRCKNRVACLGRALGPTPAKTVARHMSQGRLRA